jgi:FKBP-type peptidyl-prolyl cis-trans isomerase FklB
MLELVSNPVDRREGNEMTYMIAAMIGIMLFAANCFGADGMELKDRKDKESYSLGYQFGQSLKSQGLAVNLEVYTAGIRDALSGTKPMLSQEEVNKTVSGIQSRVMAARQKEFQETADKKLSEGKDFMEANKKKEGMKTLSSGLQYKILAEGSGKTPKAADEVTVHYRGTLTDGTEFDSSYSRGRPLTVKVNGVIRGWSEALQLMKEGSRWQLFIPPDLAYGERGMSRIPPNSILIFEVELISVK